jgi:type IV secretory pathway VirB10-like protein
MRILAVSRRSPANTCSNCEQSESNNVGSSIVSAGTPFLPQPNAIQATLHVAEGAQISVLLTHDIRVQAWTPRPSPVPP